MEKMVGQKESKLNDVTIIRCFAVLSLVAWHCFCPYVAWNMADTPANGAYRTIFHFIAPDANMPLFTALSGYLFSFLYNEKGKYREFKPFLLNKVNRLFVPFLILGAATNLTEYGKEIIQLFYGAPSHLWFCLMLFYCFMACWFVENKLGRRWNIVLMTVSFIVVFSRRGNGGVLLDVPLGLFAPLFYYSFFYLGFLTFCYKEKLMEAMGKWWPAVLVFYLATAFKYGICMGAAAASLFFLLLFVCNRFKTIAGTENYPPRLLKTLNSISKYSFGIYVFHQWIVWNLTRIPASAEYLQPIMEKHYAAFPIILWMSVFCISWLLTHLATKTRVGKYLLM